jgi:hypothetical protein
MTLSPICKHLIDHLDGQYDPEEKPRLIPSLLLPGALGNDFCTEQSLAEILRRVQADRRPVDNAMVRVYIDGIFSAEQRAHFFAQPIHPGEGFSSWLARSIGAERFGVVINGLERWSDELAQRVLKLVTELFAAWGTPECSLELTLFAGNYGFTPFGIHLDDPFTNTVHLHLGPGAKRMVLFSPDIFHALNGPEKRSYDYDRLLPHGDSTVIQAGDAYLLPAHYYHVGVADEYSVGLAACIGRFPQAELQKRAFRVAEKAKANAAASPATQKTEALSKPLPGSSPEEAERNYTAAEISKGGLKFRSRFRRSSLDEHSAVQLDPAWPIVRGHHADDAAVFARGHQIRVPDAPADRLLEMLVSKIAVEALQRRFAETIACVDLLRFLTELDSAGVLLVGPAT